MEHIDRGEEMPNTPQPTGPDGGPIEPIEDVMERIRRMAGDQGPRR